MSRFIAFDVETPNRFNNRMSAIGITVIEDGIITEEIYSLVNPEQHFDSFNVMLTGITPEMVADKPNFFDLWQDIEPVMSSGILVAHNAPFDMSVLASCLKAYGIAWKNEVCYACTCRMARKLLPDLENHKLNTMCRHYGISLDHHLASSDSRACAELILKYLDMGADVDSFLRIYNTQEKKTLR